MAHPIHDAKLLRWGRLEGFVDPAEIVVRDVQRNDGDVIIQLL